MYKLTSIALEVDEGGENSTYEVIIVQKKFQVEVNMRWHAWEDRRLDAIV